MTKKSLKKVNGYENVENVLISKIVNPINRYCFEDLRQEYIAAMTDYGWCYRPMVLVDLNERYQRGLKYQALYGTELLEAARVVGLKKIPAIVIYHDLPNPRSTAWKDAQSSLEGIPFAEHLTHYLEKCEAFRVRVPEDVYALIRKEGL
jgi:hypothetical protein